MAKSLPALSGTTHPFEAFVAASALGLAMLQVGELPRQAALHGGWAFVGAWLLCLLMLALPIVLTEFMLGRRAKLATPEGMAILTREADAKRGWRVSAWGMLLVSVLTMVLLALLAGGNVNFLARELELTEGAVHAIPAAAWVLPLSVAVLLSVAAGIAVMPSVWQKRIVTSLFLPVVVLLALSGLAGVSMTSLLYAAKPLTLAAWQAAAQLALLGAGAGLGVFWIVGAGLPEKTTLGRLGLIWLVAHAALGVLLLLAMAPFVAVAQINATMALSVTPTGATVWLTLSALVLLALQVLPLLALPVSQFLQEKGVARWLASGGVFVLSAALALTLWFFTGELGVKGLLQAVLLVMLIVLAVQSVFSGMIMKTSHARKALILPSEALYNLWRVAVRLVVPLAVLWVLAGLLMK